MNTLKFCLKCGHAIGAEEKFCGGCGASIAEMEQQQNNAVAASAPAANTQQVPPVANNPQQVPPISNPQQPNFNNGMPASNQNFYNNPAMPTAAVAAKPNPITKLVDLVKQKPKYFAIGGAALVVIIVAIIILCNIFKYQVIDAKDLFKFEFTGVNTAGSCEASIHSYDEYVYSMSSSASKLADALGDYADELDMDELTKSSTSKAEKESDVSHYFAVYEDNLTEAFSKAGDMEEAEEMRDALLNSKSKLKIKLSKESGLSNGDKISCTVTYNEDYLKEHNIKLKNTEFDTEVKDLEEGEKLDFFSGVEVNFEGNDGEGQANVNTGNAMGLISYDYDYVSDLSNGDKFVVTATLYDYTKSSKDEKDTSVWAKYDGKYYVAPNYTETKEYEVSGLKELEELDVFENITLTYESASPYLSVRIDDSNCSEIVKNNVYFSLEKYDDYKLGDKVTVLASVSRSLSDDGYKAKGEKNSDGYYTKEIEIDDKAPAYVSETTAKTFMDTQEKQFEAYTNKIKSETKNAYYLGDLDLDGKIKSVSSFDEVKSYVFVNNKDSSSDIGWSDAKARLGKLYKITLKLEEENKTAYCLICYDNIYTVDGEIKCDNDPSVKYYDTKEDADTAMKAFETTYTVSEVTDSAAGATDTTTTTTTTAEAETTTTTTKADEKTTTTKKSADDKETTTTTLVP